MTETDDSRILDDPDANHGDDETQTPRWYDGQPEAIGVLSAIVFPLTTVGFMHMTIESFKHRDVLFVFWFLLGGLPVIPLIIISFLGMKFGFRAYPRANVVLAIVQIPLCFIAPD